MLSGDFLMRQVHQLAQVLARVLVRRQTEDVHEALEELAEAWKQDPLLGASDPAALPREDLFAACSLDGRLLPDKALVVAELLAVQGDLLAESGQPAAAHEAWTRALWLYEASRNAPGATLPFDIFERIDQLQTLLAD